VVDDMVILVTGVNSGAMALSHFVIINVVMLEMSEIRSSCCHIYEVRKSMRPTKQSGTFVPLYICNLGYQIKFLFSQNSDITRNAFHIF
jgi:hypothetical protein